MDGMKALLSSMIQQKWEEHRQQIYGKGFDDSPITEDVARLWFYFGANAGVREVMRIVLERASEDEHTQKQRVTTELQGVMDHIRETIKAFAIDWDPEMGTSPTPKWKV